MADYRDSITDALRFWERGRVLFNAVLAITVAGVMGSSLLTVPWLFWGGLVVAAVAANLCYSMAYVPDLLVQSSDYAGPWRRYGRPGLWLAGTAASAVMAALTTVGLTLSLAP